MSANYFMGKSDFIWFIGVVEDINDPLFLGRCRVRCYGIHTDDKSEIPTDSLPWAAPIQPITSAGLSGIGESPTGILQGSTVVGFFRDGLLCQQPVIMGTLGGVNNTLPDSTTGFSDPSGLYPKSNYLRQPDTNKLALGNRADTIVSEKISDAKKNINHKTPDFTTTDKNWSEPETPYSAKYPYNKVKETQSGHIQEFDDTPGAERIHTYHTSGTFEEIHPDGKKVAKIVSDDYHLVAGKEFVHIIGNVNVMLGPLSGDANSQQGNISVFVLGNSDIQIEGNANTLVKGDATIKTEKKTFVHAEQGLHAYSNNGISINDDERFKLYTKNGDVLMRCDGDFKIKADGNVVIQGKFVDLNP